MRASTSSSSLSSSERFWKTDPLDLMLGLISTFLVAHAISWPYLLGLRICFFERRQFLWVNWKDLHARLPAHFAAQLPLFAASTTASLAGSLARLPQATSYGTAWYKPARRVSPAELLCASPNCCLSFFSALALFLRPASFLAWAAAAAFTSERAACLDFFTLAIIALALAMSVLAMRSSAEV